MSGSAQEGRVRRMGLFGDLPARLLRRGAMAAPWFVEPVVVAGWTLLIFILARTQRRAVMANLRAMFPAWSPARGLYGTLRVFHHFAVTQADAVRTRTHTGGVDWKIDGKEHLDDAVRPGCGCLLLTAHMGNYDMAATLFSEIFQGTIYSVRAPEKEPELQRLREEEQRVREKRYPNFRTLYNREGEMLGVKLLQLLHEGQMVALQGDRVMFDVSGQQVEVEPGLKMTLPRGPLALAALAGVPVYPIFVLRDGWRKYHIHILPRLELPPRRRGGEEGLEFWARALYRILREHWVQWAVFEQLLVRAQPKSS